MDIHNYMQENRLIVLTNKITNKSSKFIRFVTKLNILADKNSF